MIVDGVHGVGAAMRSNLKPLGGVSTLNPMRNRRHSSFFHVDYVDNCGAILLATKGVSWETSIDKLYREALSTAQGLVLKIITFAKPSAPWCMFRSVLLELCKRCASADGSTFLSATHKPLNAFSSRRGNQSLARTARRSHTVKLVGEVFWHSL